MSTPGRITPIVLLTVAAFVAGNIAKRRPTEAATITATRQVSYWACPMHPRYRSDHPGECPSCGMRLEAVDPGGSQAQAGVAAAPGRVQVSAAKQQLIGVRTDVVQRASASGALRVPGRIAVDEARLYRLLAAADGWILDLGNNPAGTFVKKDQILATYYVRELAANQQKYLYAFEINRQFEQAPATNPPLRSQARLSLQSALDTLRGVGMTDAQIQELVRTGEPTPNVVVCSPVTGFVLARNVSPDQRFDKGIELYRVADISHVWVIADIFEKDQQFLTPGAMATVRYNGREFRARMSDHLPQLDPQTRTLKTRFEMDNPGYVLRPDAFVDVELTVNMPPAVTVPADAVIDTGRQKTVYVEREGGMFEPRFVETGWRLGDRVQIAKGLEAGEHVVVAGNFLLDSESRMKPVAVSNASMLAEAAPEKDPVCGMEVDPKTPKALKSQYGGKTYYFCSDNCRRTFEAKPEKYTQKERGKA